MGPKELKVDQTKIKYMIQVNQTHEQVDQKSGSKKRIKKADHKNPYESDEQS